MSDITAIIGAQLVALRGSATSSTHQIVIPASVGVGDLAVIFDHADTNFGPPAKVVPSGWTEIQSTVDLDIRHVSSYRIIQAGDAGSTVTCMNGGTTDAKIMFVFSGVNGRTPTFSDKDIELTNGNPSSQACSAASSPSNRTIVLAACGDEFGGGSDFSTETPALDDVITVGQFGLEYMRAGYKIYNGPASNHTFDFDDNGSGNYLESFYVSLA